MNIKKSLFSSLLIFLTLTVNAAEVSKHDIFISFVGAMGDSIATPVYSNTTIIGFNDFSWLPSSCSTADGVIVSSYNPAMLDIALAAVQSGKSVFARVESTSTTGIYCELIQLNVSGQVHYR